MLEKIFVFKNPGFTPFFFSTPRIYKFDVDIIFLLEFLEKYAYSSDIRNPPLWLAKKTGSLCIMLYAIYGLNIINRQNKRHFPSSSRYTQTQYNFDYYVDYNYPWYVP